MCNKWHTASCRAPVHSQIMPTSTHIVLTGHHTHGETTRSPQWSNSIHFVAIWRMILPYSLNTDSGPVCLVEIQKSACTSPIEMIFDEVIAVMLLHKWRLICVGPVRNSFGVESLTGWICTDMRNFAACRKQHQFVRVVIPAVAAASCDGGAFARWGTTSREAWISKMPLFLFIRNKVIDTLSLWKALLGLWVGLNYLREIWRILIE